MEVEVELVDEENAASEVPGTAKTGCGAEWERKSIPPRPAMG